ncbi:MAG TPA: extracellular solute-binding protein [Amycolatopsis sp.]|nr:extracellular solute-binding protein [Amycolatopsis sp.]
MTIAKSVAALGLAALALMPLSACGNWGGSKADATVESVGNMDALVNAAKKEGSVTLYSSSVEAIDSAEAKAFQAKYGITVNIIKIGSGELAARYQTEASAGNVQADVIASTCSDAPTFKAIVDKGWATPAKDLGLPALSGAGASALAVDGVTFKYVLMPVAIGYNTAMLKGADVPKDWTALGDPKYRGKIVFVDPDTSGPFYWTFLQWLDNTYGDDLVRAVGAQQLSYADVTTARNQLGAGQYAVDIPTFKVSMNSTAATGAPVAAAVMPKTTANESCIGVSGPKAPHPNAAKLYANFMTTPEGAAAINSVDGVLSPFGGASASMGNPDPFPTSYDENHLRGLLGKRK